MSQLEELEKKVDYLMRLNVAKNCPHTMKEGVCIWCGAYSYGGMTDGSGNSETYYTVPFETKEEYMIEDFGWLLGKKITSESPREDLIEAIRVLLKQAEHQRSIREEKREFDELIKKAKARL